MPKKLTSSTYEHLLNERQLIRQYPSCFLPDLRNPLALVNPELLGCSEVLITEKVDLINPFTVCCSMDISSGVSELLIIVYKSRLCVSLSSSIFSDIRLVA